MHPLQIVIDPVSIFLMIFLKRGPLRRNFKEGVILHILHIVFERLKIAS